MTEDFPIPDELVEFIELETAYTPFSEAIAHIFPNMVKEYIRAKEILQWGENADLDRIPKGYTKGSKKFNFVAAAIEKEMAEDGRRYEKQLIQGSFLQSLCLPDDKQLKSGRSIKILIPTYIYLDRLLKAEKVRSGVYWIWEWKNNERKKSNAVHPEIQVLNLDFKTNFSQVTIPKIGNESAEKFYSGFPVSYGDIKSNFDFERNIYRHKNIDGLSLKELIVAHFEQLDSTYILLKGNAGVGKTVLLKRISCDLAELGRHVFFIDSDWHEGHLGDKIQVQIKRLIDQVPGATIIIDGIAKCILKDELNIPSLIEYSDNKHILFIVSEQPVRWHSVSDSVRSMISNERFYLRLLGRLEENECHLLVDKLSNLEENGSLPYRMVASRRERLKICLDSAERHLLIALLQTRFCRRLADIISEEFSNIPSNIGKQAYLLVCFWHSLEMKIPEILLFNSVIPETSLEIVSIKTSTEGLIFDSGTGFIARHYIIVNEICRNFIGDKFGMFTQLKKTFLGISDNKEIKRFLNDFFAKDNCDKALLKVLHKDGALIEETFNLLLQFRNLYSTELLRNILSSYGMVEHKLNNDDKAIKLFEEIIEKVDKKYSFAYRQIAWIETDNGNLHDAIYYAKESDRPDFENNSSAYHLIQVAKIFSLNTVSSFYEADKYYRRAIDLGNEERHKREYNKYLESAKILEIFVGIADDNEIPQEVVKALKPNLRFLKKYFGIDHKEYQNKLYTMLHFMEGDLSGTLEDVEEVIGDFNVNKNKRIKSKYYSNLARVKFIEWRNSYGVAGIEKIMDYFNTSLELSPDDPFTHCWLGTYYKEVLHDFDLAEKEYMLAINLSEKSKDDFDREHPIFKNNQALLIMANVISGKKGKADLNEALEMLDYSVKINNKEKRQFFWAEDNMLLCQQLILGSDTSE